MFMKTELVDVSPTRKELKIEIDAAEVRAEYDRVSDRYARLANVPGFRKGHAPRNIVRQRFKNEIRSEVLQQVVPQAISDAVTASALNVIGEPDVHLDNNEGLDKFGEQPISLHVHVEVFPEVTLGQYKGLELSRHVRPVTERDVEEVIEGLREGSATLQPVEDRGAQAGDTVTVDFQGRFVNTPADEDINVEDVDVVLGGEGVVPEFSEQLAGMKADDVKTFTVKYPEEFTSQGLAGKEVEYTATVSAVRVKETPAFDDEWTKSLGEEGIESVQALRDRVRENLTQHAQHESERRLRDEAMDKLVAAHEFEVPATFVEMQTQQLLQSSVRDLLRRGIDPRQQELNWEGLRDALQPRAMKDLRSSMLLERIADEERIEVSDEEVEAEIASLSAATRQPVEQVRAALTKQGGERSIADRLRSRKALDLLVENATVRDEEWSDEEEEVPPADSITPPESQEVAKSSAAGGGETQSSEGQT